MDLTLVIDRSGSMETNGKEDICVNVIRAIETISKIDDKFNSLTIKNKLTFTENQGDFEQLKLQIANTPTIIVTDGYYFFDFYKEKINAFLEENINSLYFIICGSDGIDLSIYKKSFPQINVYYPHNIVDVLEKLNENYN